MARTRRCNAFDGAQARRAEVDIDHTT